jgi:hypothetical protein
MERDIIVATLKQHQAMLKDLGVRSSALLCYG